MENVLIPEVKSIKNLALGIDIGSTTAKVVLIKDGTVLYECYERHYSQVRQKTLELVQRVENLINDEPIYVSISGSAGLGVAKAAGIPFVQEVFATAETVKELASDTDVVIELGGEDAKVVFFTGGTDERMNGSCAGGTGAFIDQMATLMNVSTQELDDLSLDYQRIYPIASRCGVFAKTDIQPLLNQGARKQDVAMSIYQAVVDQTIAGLAQGRRIKGNVMFLGGPLYYCKGLRERFVSTLKLQPEGARFPEYGRLSVAIGAAIYASKQNKTFTYSELVESIEKSFSEKNETPHLEPLFENQAAFDEFEARHKKATVLTADPKEYKGDAYLGIDCGSTTTKVALITDDDRILYTYYNSNKGNPVAVIKKQLGEIYELCGDNIKIAASVVTGYGEELIQNAFNIDEGLVETMAHFTAARHFNPNVDFILDIGGQDIKCFKIHNKSIDSIMLNEACSSGCGSFIETFARSMGYEIEEFSKFGLFAKEPVDLGSRCTVFMNSSVKQAQKDGAGVGDISAGLSMSVVKNAIYKVIRANSADELGSQIVVQGGTFLNDAVLRSFEKELGCDVVRPQIAGLMGAYGAALYAKTLGIKNSEIITPKQLETFVHESKAVSCKGCTNKCNLTINTFGDGKKFISGNQCEKGAGKTLKKADIIPNLHQYKRDKLMALEQTNGERGTIGLPLSLGMYELAPLWHSIFSSLGFSVVLSGLSNRRIYSKGQFSIPSDTACYPAKIMHGHIEKLVEQGVDAIFYPCLTYNIDEKISENHYNCPVVAYYSELLNSNVESLKKTKFLYPYLNLNNQVQLSKEIYLMLSKNFGGISYLQVRKAVKQGFIAYYTWMQDIRDEGEKAVAFARENGKRIMVLAGRPYHVDPEIGHGIDKLAASLGFVVVSEDSISGLAKPESVNVLNQWTYHARLYNVANYVAKNADCELVQLVSFGCGLDAITTDEVKGILEKRGKLYTQIKIDEITNLGAVKIRLRSLLGALEERGENYGEV
ncbi:MAG: 2-hydroxyglutaryl-CoA dehydratase [Clostridia bacterium]|nr:2-hydroxyglutaryl-CoA dehydratase [Clostridia bacterium]